MIKPYELIKRIFKENVLLSIVLKKEIVKVNILFCSDPLNSKKVDLDWLEEYQFAKQLNMNIVLFDYDTFKNNPARELINISSKPEKLELIVYRGWMMPVEMYRKLYESLAKSKSSLSRTFCVSYLWGFGTLYSFRFSASL